MNTRLLLKGSLIYRSYNDISNREGFWFSLDKTDTYGYGSHTAEFRLSRDLVLADITNPLFYEQLKDWLKDLTSRVVDLKQEHPFILFPLGFDDIVFYKDFARLIGIDVDAFGLSPVVHTESLLYFGNRSRSSIRQCDIKMMEILKVIIGTVCDGICSLNKFPDIIRNGMHHPEISVFDNTHLEFVQDVARPVIGGSLTADDSPRILTAMNLDNEIIRNYVNLMDENLVKLRKMNLKFDIEIIKHPVEQGDNTIITKKMFRKTRKRARV